MYQIFFHLCALSILCIARKKIRQNRLASWLLCFLVFNVVFDLFSVDCYNLFEFFNRKISFLYNITFRNFFLQIWLLNIFLKKDNVRFRMQILSQSSCHVLIDWKSVSRLRVSNRFSYSQHSKNKLPHV